MNTKRKTGKLLYFPLHSSALFYCITHGAGVKKEDADLLQIQLPAAVLLIERISYLEGDLPFEVVRNTYRADRYKFTTEIQR